MNNESPQWPPAQCLVIAEIAQAHDGSLGMAHAYVDGTPTVPGFLQDHVQMAAALLDAFEVSGEVRYLTAARDSMDYTLEAFGDEEGGGFFDRPLDPRPLGVLGIRSKPFDDGPTPAANPVAGDVLIRLYYLTNHPEYQAAARETLRAFAGAPGSHRIHAASYALALGLYLDPPAHAVIIGKRSAPETGALWRAALRAYRPGKIVAAYDPEEVKIESLPPAVAAAVRIGQQDRKAKAYVCVGQYKVQIKKQLYLIVLLEQFSMKTSLTDYMLFLLAQQMLLAMLKTQQLTLGM